jgi:hypothetical protein
MVIEHNFNILTCMIPNSAGHLFIVDSHFFAVHRNRYCGCQWQPQPAHVSQKLCVHRQLITRKTDGLDMYLL